jgi:biotin synthase
MIRHNWTQNEVQTLFELPFNDLLYQAQTIHRQNFDPNQVQISTLLSIKTGACPEDCAYCPQSVHYDTGVEHEKLMDKNEVIEKAKKAKKAGATRFCMGAGWRSPRDKQLDDVIDMVKAVKDMGLETCITVGMLNEQQVDRLAEAGLDYYNHNLDTSPEYYEKIISTRTYQDRLDTIEHVRNSSIKVCCGGIVGMGETLTDRINFLIQLANLPEHPESVPINMLIRIEGTPLENLDALDPIEFTRTVAIARIMMPKSFVRLSAGRAEMSDELQAMCFFAGANSIHYGEKLLVTPLPDTSKDQNLFNKLGIKPYVPEGYCADANKASIE